MKSRREYRLRQQLGTATEAADRARLLNELAREVYRRDRPEALELSRQAGQAAGDQAPEELLRSLCMQAALAREAGLLDEAWALLEHAHSHADELQDIAVRAELLQLRAHVGIQRDGDVRTALRLCRNSISLLRRSGRPAQLARGHATLGAIHLWHDDFQKAAAEFSQALELSDPSARAEYLDRLAVAHFSSGELSRALELFEESIELCRGQQDRWLLCDVLYHAGCLYLDLGDHVAAQRLYIECMQIAEDIDARPTLSKAHGGLSILHRRLGELQQALDHAERSLEIKRTIGAREPIAIMLSTLGTIYHQQGEYAAAVGCFNEALEITERLGLRETQAVCLGNLANSLDALGQYREAIDRQQHALEIYSEIGRRRGLAASLHGLGRHHQAADGNDIDTPLEYFTRALAIAAEIKADDVAAEVHRDLSVLFERRNQPGDLERAFEHFRHAAQIRGELLNAEKQREIHRAQMRVEIERNAAERRQLQQQLQQLQLDMQRKVEELNAMAVRVLEKSELVDTLRRQLAELRSDGNDESDAVIDRIERQIAMHAATEADWQAFDRQLETVHHGFMVELSQSHPELTPAELKVCALLRTQLSTKEIATLLNVSNRAVEKHRYQIRRKLGLQKKENLTTWLLGVTG